MERVTLKLTNSEGLHARPAAIFVQRANRFISDISLEYEGKIVSGKSIIGIMSLGAFSGEEISIIAEGEDSKLAIEHLQALIENDFNEV